MRGHVLSKVLIAALLTGSLMLSAAVSADTAVERVGWPDVSFDQAVPTLESVLGYAPGERITSVDQAHIYLRALAAAIAFADEGAWTILGGFRWINEESKGSLNMWGSGFS